MARAKRTYTFRHCRVRECGRDLAKQNHSGFCSVCQRKNILGIERVEPERAAKRKAYFAEWRKRNAKVFGKKRPTAKDRLKLARKLVREAA